MALTETLKANVEQTLAGLNAAVSVGFGEVTVVVPAEHYIAASLCGVDYSTYGDGARTGLRFAAVTHLLSVVNNQRLRLRVFCPDDDFPVVASLFDVWPACGWYEREAFDLFGIVFDGHTDLRRILTDYGFIGHPFRKDFPVTGYVEMRYDPEQKRVVYQPVTIEPRENTPRVIREKSYGA
jgi:NADH-quinone oxidoreductase subunit C